jgi:uncharacterized protein YggE
MKRTIPILFLLLIFAVPSFAQSQDVKVTVDTIAVQAEGTYATDPDLATLTFVVSTQEKELKKAYDSAATSMQRIGDLAARNGLQKDEITTGVLTVYPYYDNGDRKRKTRAYGVNGNVVLRVKDFSKIGPIIDEAIQDGITDFRSLTYSLSDEEAAKQKAVGEAMRRAVARAGTALEQRGQKLGNLRYANLDVKQVEGISRVDMLYTVGMAAETIEVKQIPGIFGGAHKAAAPPPPPAVHPDKISVSATVQCVFQIQ